MKAAVVDDLLTQMGGAEQVGETIMRRNRIAYTAGAGWTRGGMDTQRDVETGIPFHQQTVDALCASVETAAKMHFDPVCIRNQSHGFGTSAFRRKMVTVAGMRGKMKRGNNLAVMAG